MVRPFASDGAPTHYAADRPIGVRHLKLELDLDMIGRRAVGRVTLDLTVRASEIAAVRLDAVDLDVRGVTVDGQAIASFYYDGRILRVPLPAPYRRGHAFSVSVSYACAPRRGLYFVGADPLNHGRALQAWTQGQDQDARHYFPCVDAPGEKATTEVLCTAPSDLFVLSNGELQRRAGAGPGRTTWHYTLDTPHAPYLLTLVAGPFVEVADRAPETGVSVHYYVPPGREADARRSFGRTPAMIDLFSKLIGVPYPHRRYSQIVVRDFIFGGMENTSATTLTDDALLDERAALDLDMDPLVAHELAHQWWGDLLTCREWPEAWLNEGFATYFEYIWREHAGGRDEADMELHEALEAYLDETGHYTRPVVCRQYEDPIDLFDRHLYEKGGRVLHMLRHELGDETFWRALRTYAERHAGGTVETRDLARAIDDAGGRNPDRFFDQWIRRPGHPILEGEWEWDADRRVGTLRIEQKQSGEPYQLGTLVRLEIDGAPRDEAVAIRERAHTFEWRLPTAPTQVVFDPGHVLLADVKLKKARPLWVRQLAGASLGLDRVLAARHLGTTAEPAAVEALRAALEKDSFWGVRAAAARALGATRRADALDALAGARHDAHPRVRQAVADALGEFRDHPRAAEILADWAAAGDPSCFAEANAGRSLGRVRGARLIELAPRLLTRDSFRDVIRARTTQGLGESRHEAALPLVAGALRPGTSFQWRRAAAKALAALAEGTIAARDTRDRLERALDDPDFRVRMEAASGLVTLNDPRAAGALERALERELDGRTRRHLREALHDLRTGARPGEDIARLKEDVRRLTDDGARLRERLEKLEIRLDRGDGGARGGEGRPRPRGHRAARPARPPRR